MAQVLGLLATLSDLALVIIGFGLIILVHELGHFLAARWAGIRVLAFAIGFGPAAISYRKGMGVRRGSSEDDYLQRTASAGKDRARGDTAGVSPTEYRLNWFPLGGYVKMLGQEDLNPAAVSQAPDSYQSCEPWKRMIVISAGVVMNMVLAAVLFILVFMIGIQSEPAKVGMVAPGSPAATAMPINADALGIDRPGLRAGDEILSVNGDSVRDFNNLNLKVVMAGPNEPLTLRVDRRGHARPVRFEITPEKDPYTGLQRIGVAPAFSTTVPSPSRPSQRKQMREALARADLQGLEPGTRLVEADGRPIRHADELDAIADASGGEPIELVFEVGDGSRVTHLIEPVPEYQRGFRRMPDDTRVPVEHLAGLTPVMTVERLASGGRKAGLEPGDIFVRIGSVEYPSLWEGVLEIEAHAGREIRLAVQREAESGDYRIVELTARVGGDGKIGFTPGQTDQSSALLGTPLERVLPPDQPETDEPRTTPAAGLIHRPGSRVVALAGQPVATFAEMREIMQREAQRARDQGRQQTDVPMTLELPLPAGDDGQRPTRKVTLALDQASIEEIAGLGWSMPFSVAIFEPEHITLRADDPLHAIGLGLAETHRVMMTTYLTFARLFQGTVQVRHLKGPVGIAHLGTRVAERGLIWLLFFMALISVNLAVINFLPLPIVDGGQFLMILYEQIRGQPVPVVVQNAVTLAGLVLIATVFLVVTYHDITGIFGG